MNVLNQLITTYNTLLFVVILLLHQFKLNFPKCN